MPTKPEDGMASLFANLENMTGKSIDAWVVIGRGTGVAKHKELVALLKSEHGLTHGYAHQIALRSLTADDAPKVGSEELVELQYSGSKAPLKPIYDALKQAALSFGSDVEFSPKKGYVSLRRNKQFAMIQPSTANRLDVGLILKNTTLDDRLELSGSFNTMFSHRIRIGKVTDVDETVIGWLRKAYDSA